MAMEHGAWRMAILRMPEQPYDIVNPNTDLLAKRQGVLASAASMCSFRTKYMVKDITYTTAYKTS
jgi:hypothetical protein